MNFTETVMGIILPDIPKEIKESWYFNRVFNNPHSYYDLRRKAYQIILSNLEFGMTREQKVQTLRDLLKKYRKERDYYLSGYCVEILTLINPDTYWQKQFSTKTGWTDAEWRNVEINFNPYII